MIFACLTRRHVWFPRERAAGTVDVMPKPCQTTGYRRGEAPTTHQPWGSELLAGSVVASVHKQQNRDSLAILECFAPWIARPESSQAGSRTLLGLRIGLGHGESEGSGCQVERRPCFEGAAATKSKSRA